MRIFLLSFILICSLGLNAQEAFFQWKITQPDRWFFLLDSISKALPLPSPNLQDPISSESWVKEKWEKSAKERKITIRFLVLSKALNSFIEDSAQILEKRKLLLLEDSLPERHKIAIQGIEKMQQGIRDLAKTWWPQIIEKELALMEWECHEVLLKKTSNLGISPALSDSIWAVGMIRNAQEALLLKNQLLPWNGINVRSKQVFAIKCTEAPSIMKNNWNYFHGCDSNSFGFNEVLWKNRWSENRWLELEKEIGKETAYFKELQKNRENWEFLDRRENTLERMRAYVIQYDKGYFYEDSIRAAGIMRARSAQELLDLKRERERWKIGYYQKGLAQLADLGHGIEGGPTVKDYSKQKGYFKLKDVQNVKKQIKNTDILENIQEEKESIIPIKPFEMLQIPQWNGLPYTFKTLK